VSEGFSNRGLPKSLGYHSFMTVDEGGQVTSVHQVPDEPFVHTCDPDAKCLCGPQLVISILNGRPMPMMRHAALDPVYHQPPNFDEIEIDFDDWYGEE
jgi:hypothetical protein